MRAAGLICALALAIPAFAVENNAPPVRATVLTGIAGANLCDPAVIAISDGALKLTWKTTSAKIDIASIDEIHLSSEVTQGGGKFGTAAKVLSAAAPYGSGKLVTLMLSTKVDVLTVVYHGEYGELHSALLTLPQGKAEAIRAQLVAAGAQQAAKAE